MPPRSPVNLSSLRPKAGSQHKQKRVGRGQGSGYGRTAGRGMNGQNSRSGGGVRPGFAGGQTTIAKSIPKRGFTNPTSRTWAAINLDRIQAWITQGRLSCSPERPITARELLLSGCIHQVRDGVKILATGSEHLNTPLFITPSRASMSAIKAIEASGGKVVCKYYNALALRDTVKGRTDRTEAAPTRREDIEWYTNFRNRGYLSKATLDHGPSVPWIQPRWRQLADELNKYRRQTFDGEKRASSK